MKNWIRILPAILLAILLVSACTVQNKNPNAEEDTILDAYWTLMSLEGQEVQRPQSTMTAFIRFEEGKSRVHGYTGCNRFNGTYTYGDESLAISELSTTRMACPDMEMENKFMAILRRVDRYEVSGDVLTLFSGGKAVATFMSGTERSIDNRVGGSGTLDLDSVRTE
ncbi:META domain-containing protein [Pontibacter mangrovi]|nr:META domain-containing protein [Pontibacter mangrovi]